jgi:peroxiredoxin
VLIRNNAPVFGANASPYQQRGDWQLSLSARNLISNDHYNGKVEQHERQERENYITNRQNLFDIGITRALTKRVSLTVGVPFVFSSWAFRDPSSPLPGPRIEEPQWGRGLGDISITGRSWIFDPDTHPDWNVTAGGGLKFPTGNAAYLDNFLVVRGAIPGILGNPVPNFEPREEKQYVDQSVQPGDGGWGLIMETQAFWRVKQVFLFAAGSYLVNPQDTNDTPSILQTLGVPPAPGSPNALARLEVNSIPDQYLARVGGAIPVGKGFSASLGWRMEGLKQYDLLGDSHGWRRPGTAMFIEPGVSFTHGPHTVAFNVPIGYYFNRHRNPITDNPGDATFPEQIFLTSYSLRLRRQRGASAVTQPSTPDTSQLSPGSPAGWKASAAGGPAGTEACAPQAKSANLNITLKDQNNENVNLSSYRGKVILLDYWATWCVPCKTEIPWFIDFQDRYGDQGFQVVGVSVDDPPNKLVPYISDMKMNYTVLQGRTNQKVLEAFGPINGIPVTVLISRNGKVCARFEGTKSRDAIEERIKALLSQSSGSLPK